MLTNVEAHKTTDSQNSLFQNKSHVLNMLPVVVADMHCLLFVGCAPHNGESQKLSLCLHPDIQITPNFFCTNKIVLNTTYYMESQFG